MKTSAAIKQAGNIRKLADLFGITTQAVYAWGDTVPKKRAQALRLLKNPKPTTPKG